MASSTSPSAAYLAESRQGQLIALNVTMCMIATAAVSLRFYARKSFRAGYWWDDWMCLASLPITLAVNIFSAEFPDTGQGKHEAAIPWGATRYLHQLYFELLFYNASLVFFKFSILFLYNRVFVRYSWLKIVSWALGILISLWLVAIEFVLIFQCSPIHKSWDETVPGECLDQKSLFLAQSVPTISFDISILLLAVPLVWNIQLPLSSKIALMGVFGMGGIVTLISIMRLYYTLQTVYSDLTWNYTTLALWSASEGPVGLLSACLPTFGRIIKRILGKFKVLVFSSHSKIGTNRSYGSEITPGFLSNKAIAPSDSTTNLASGAHIEHIRMQDLNHDGIRVKKDILEIWCGRSCMYIRICSSI